MQKCSCKICREGHTSTVNALPDQGLGRDEIQGWIRENLGFSVSKATLSKHFQACEVEVLPSVREVDVLPPIDLKAELGEFDVTKWLDEPNSHLIIDKLQTIHLHLHFMLAIRAKREVESYLEGRTKTFSQFVMKDLATSYEILEKLCGIDVLVSQKRALEVLEGMGYKLKGELQKQNIYPDIDKSSGMST